MQVLIDKDRKETVVSSSDYCLFLNMEKDVVMLLYFVDCSYSHSTILCFWPY